jgi:cell wall-associated protease
MKKVVYILFGLLVISQSIFGQRSKDKNYQNDQWYLQDYKKDNVVGTSTELAYKELLKKKKSQTVLVAVIDGGVDIHHEDLKNKIWTNKGEVANNNVDDDQNGYIDDVHGWSFIGGKDGDVLYENYEIVRIYKKLSSQFKDSVSEETKNSDQYKYWLSIRDSVHNQVKNVVSNFEYYGRVKSTYDFYADYLKRQTKSDELSIKKINALPQSDSTTIKAQQFMELIYQYYGSLDTDFEQVLDVLDDELKYYDVNTDYRSVVGDNPEDPTERIYGNNNVIGPDAEHGTHVAGIIAAIRDNKLGINGIADNVIIMPIRTVPEGDERDKDVANAIRYAADNGAQIINMSFGKDFSPHKEVVDEAVKYAMKKGVIMIHAAGNDGQDIGKIPSYPTKHYSEGDSARLWIEVGASTSSKDEMLPTDFSNYSKTIVDVFAPGKNILSTFPEDGYENLDGTSMAAPVVSGIAALLLSYYPMLTSEQVVDVIKKSAVKYPDLEVIRPGTGEELVKFSELSNTAGVVNTLKALQMAEELSSK